MSLYEYRAKLVRIIDGDTVVCDLDLGFGIWARHTLRLEGINAPEVRGGTEETKEQGRQATVFLEKLMTNLRPLTVETIRDKQGKFGRYLAIVFGKSANGEKVNINGQMVANGFAEKI